MQFNCYWSSSALYYRCHHDKSIGNRFIFGEAVFNEQSGAAIPVDAEGAHKHGQSGYRLSGALFLSSSSTLPLVIALTVALAPIHNIMHRALQMSSPSWQQGEMAKAAKGRERQTLLGICRSMELEAMADEALRGMFSNALCWQVLPQYARTVATRASLLRLLAATGCCMRIYLTDIHANYLFTTFSWLKEPGGLQAAFERECPKRFDRWTRA